MMEKSSTEETRFQLVPMPHWLFSQTETSGSFQILARLSASWKAPWWMAPSPK
jgi:hypothetical protein